MQRDRNQHSAHTVGRRAPPRVPGPQLDLVVVTGRGHQRPTAGGERHAVDAKLMRARDMLEQSPVFGGPQPDGSVKPAGFKRLNGSRRVTVSPHHCTGSVGVGGSGMVPASTAVCTGRGQFELGTYRPEAIPSTKFRNTNHGRLGCDRF